MLSAEIQDISEGEDQEEMCKANIKMIIGGKRHSSFSGSISDQDHLNIYDALIKKEPAVESRRSNKEYFYNNILKRKQHRDFRMSENRSCRASGITPTASINNKYIFYDKDQDAIRKTGHFVNRRLSIPAYGGAANSNGQKFKLAKSNSSGLNFSSLKDMKDDDDKDMKTDGGNMSAAKWAPMLMLRKYTVNDVAKDSTRLTWSSNLNNLFALPKH